MATYLELKDFVRQEVGDKGDTVTDDIVAFAVKSGLRRCGQHRSWSFLRDQNPLRLAGVAPYETGTVSVNHGSTTVTGSGTTFPTTCAGQFIDFQDGGPYSVISTRDSATQLTLAAAYANEGASNLSANSYQIVFPLIDVTAGTKLITSVKLARDGCPLGMTTWEDVRSRYSDSFQSGKPRVWAFWEGTSDSAVKKIAVWPAPSLVYAFDCERYKYPAVPSADGDVLEWKEEYLDLLYGASLMAAGTRLNSEDCLARCQMLWDNAINAAVAADSKTSKKITFAGGSGRGYRGVLPRDRWGTFKSADGGTTLG